MIYLTVMLVLGASMFVTFSDGKLLEYYQAIGLPEAQLKQIEHTPMIASQDRIWLGVPGWLFFFGYLFWLKKYFVAVTAKSSAF